MKFFSGKKFKSLKKCFSGIVLFSLVFSLIMPAILYPLSVNAVSGTYGSAADLASLNEGAAAAFGGGGGGIPVFDAIGNVLKSIGNAFQKLWKVEEEAADKAELTLKNLVFIALKQSLDNFLQTMSYDVATWLASGGEGQQPMFYTEGWGEYLTDLADQAGGTFIEKLGGDWLDLNVCNPSSLDLKVKLGLGLAELRRPRRPDCTVTEMVKNWDEFIDDPDFLDRFQVIFDPEYNDIGISFKIFNKYIQAEASAVQEGTLTRQVGDGFKAVTEKISDIIKTPASLVQIRAGQLSEDAVAAEWDKVQYGDIVLDAIGSFVNTLAGKLFERIFEEGLSSGSSGSSSSSDSFRSLGQQLASRLRGGLNQDLYTGDSGKSLSGREAAEIRFRDFFQVGSNEVGPYDILSKLAFCPDPENPGPEECVIKPEFRTAIEQELMVKEAVDKGFINGDAPFGFMDYDAGAIYRGIPYRSIVALRTYRVVPVGWELAAEAIKQFSPNKTYSLRELMNKYDDQNSPFYGLIDPNWVLTIPDHFCKAQGYGPKIIYEELIASPEEGVPPARVIGRAEYCADFQSCIEENDDGSCRYYGYCTEERRIWNLEGSACPEYYNTCQTFQSSSGQLASYLENSLDYNNCNIDNAGCQWYCQQYSSIDDVWTCVNESEKVLKPCNQAGGCSLTASCIVPEGENFCSDEISGANLSISSPCDANSQWWDDNGTPANSSDDPRICNVDTSCTVLQGGVSCRTTGCESLANILPNASFETGPPSFDFLAANWIPYSETSDALNFFQRVSGTGEQVYAGNYSIRFYNAGSSISKIITSESITLPADKTYTFSGFVYNRLNVGEIILTLWKNGVAVPNKSSSLKNQWEEINFDFKGSAGDKIEVRVRVSGQLDGAGPVSGTAWFDNFKISESCVTNPVRLTLIGEIEKDESKLHLDRDAQECSADADGCSQFIQTLPNAGTNLVGNSSFENWPNPNDLPLGWEKGENWYPENKNKVERNEEGAVGNLSLKLTNGGSASRDLSTLPLPGVRPNTTYRVSFWAKSDAEILPGDKRWYAEFQLTHPDEISGGSCTTEGCDWQWLYQNGERYLHLTDQWQRFVMDATTTPILGTEFKLGFLNQDASSNYLLYIDGVQIEEVDTRNPIVSNYKDYGAVNLTYLQKSPDYLGCSGNYENDPGECFNYALYCKEEEVGCQAYTPLSGGPAVPGVVTLEDYCPAECVGYSGYKQSTTHFESEETLEYFIPRTARQCSAVSAGCDEFTNLDEVAKGGEGREYYQYLRQCEKPDDSAAACQNFYTWQGSEDTGYQLRVYSLSSDGNKPRVVIDNPEQWPETWGDSEDCNGPGDVLTNPFCREFYDINGVIHYEIEQNTISCFDDCHPFRKTSLGESEQETLANCQEKNPLYDTHPELAWRDGACVYQAIPGQGLACSAQAAGCREYRGNTGGNVFTALFENFEDGEETGWQSGSISNEALAVAGHSLFSHDERIGQDGRIESFVATLSPTDTVCSDALPVKCDSDNPANCYDASLNKCIAQNDKTLETCLVDIGDSSCGLIENSFRPSKTYIVSFWAKSATANIVPNVQINLPGAVSDSIGSTNIKPEWSYYTFGPFVSQSDIAPDARLIFLSAGQNFYLDNIEIKEVRDYVYVIKNSWRTPVSCDTNPWTQPSPTPAPQFMLGCKQYRDAYNRIHNLKSFSSLCREEAVGCEAMVDTFNSSSPFSQTFNAGDEISEVNVPQDKLVYIVNRPEYQCSASAKGCEAMGLPSVNTQDQVTGYQTAYLINDPDNYNSILCASPEVGCEEWQSADGFTYFKDPGDKTCEYKLVPNKDYFDWFKTGSVSLVPDCPKVSSLVGEPHPDNGWAGMCPTEFSSCTQFIDPASTIAKNLLFNPDFSQSLAAPVDGWEVVVNSLTQSIQLKQNTLYTFAVTKKAGASLDSLSFDILCSDATSFDYSMTPVNGGLELPRESYFPDNRRDEIAGFPEETSYSGRFLVPNNQPCELVVTGSSINDIKSKIKEVSVRETGSYYVLSDTVDRFSCNGVVSKEQGCVLFNDRSRVSYKIGEDDISYLNFDADVSGSGINSGLPVVDCAGSCDSNAILSVRPDRTCGEWLACTSFAPVIEANGEEKNYCLSLAPCNSLADDGSCNSFVEVKKEGDRSDYYSSPSEIANLSGYSNAGLAVSGQGIVHGYYPYGEMTERGGAVNISNGNFESSFGNTSEPIGWTTASFDPAVLGEAPPLEWLDSKFKIERDSAKAIEGSGYLRLNTFWEAVSEQMDVEPNTEYTLSGMVNAFYLQHPQATSSARILIELLNPAGNSVDIGCPTETDYSGQWQSCSGLQVAEGLDWQHVTKVFNSGPAGTKLRIKLSNYVNNKAGCTADGANGRYDLNSNCELGGYSLFDNIQVKPVLEVQELDPEFITRSCRLYPAADSPACRYTEGDTLFYGQYGYCLTPDPNNENQCLQWWPVDQIQGETFDDVIGGYADRIPLDYCVHKAEKEIQISQSGTLARISPEAEEVVGRIIDDAGNSMNFIPFDIFDDYRPLARYPYMEKFVFNGAGAGVDVNYQLYIALPFSITMYKDHYCYKPIDVGGYLSSLTGSFNLGGGVLGSNWWSRDDSDSGCDTGEGIRMPLGGSSLGEEEEWGGWAALPIAIRLADGLNIVFIIPLSWDKISGNLGDLTSYASTLINTGGSFNIGPPFGARIITDQDGSFGGITEDPLPDVEGDILGVAWFLKTVKDAAAIALSGRFSGEMEIQYCDELVRVATSAGNNKSYANRVTIGSGYVLNENVDKDLDGTADSSSDPDNYENVNYLYYKPFNYRDFLYSTEEHGGNYFFYQSSDYQPFGALVPPSNAQYPTAWDSRQSVYRQPLFYEPPRTSAFDAPYQARMGELHSLDGLKNIFAKSYGIWHWEWINENKPKDGGQYKEGALISSGTTLWDLPTDAAPCPGNVRPASGPLCLVSPNVNTIKVNDKDSEQLKSNGLVKLSFNTKVDPDQLPIVSYKVDWGDGKKDIVSGVTLLNRTNPDNPFFLYHFYDFWEMQRAGISCGAGSCSAQITITLKDNWNAQVSQTATGIVTVLK